jgi:hypothetical protein
MNLSVQVRITIFLLCLQAVLLGVGLFASDHAYFLWAIGGAGFTVAMMVGAAAAPVAILVGILRKMPTLRRCGYALLILNTIPLVIIFAVGESLFGNQYEARRADGTLRTESIEQAQ